MDTLQASAGVMRLVRQRPLGWVDSHGSDRTGHEHAGGKDQHRGWTDQAQQAGWNAEHKPGETGE